ncbi:toll-like receptor 4 [Branchiostoma floridae]|uniref:Toll-like receptor 4 n=1 Tax=Branchiostoma floridae TaxID=7739 RepID=A0A9J7HIA9_BRAFL|nr:toll-like receptor 4 [Branchiostoma floridae]
MESTSVAFGVCIVVSLFITTHLEPVEGESTPLCQIWNSTTVDCTYTWDKIHQPLNQVPPGIPKSVTELTLTGNNITRLYNDSFEGLTNLKHLDLSQTRIRTIQKGAFEALKNLTWLDIAFSTDTTHLENNLFGNLASLKYLVLEMSAHTFGEHIFGGLAKLKYLHLRLVDASNLPDQSFYPLASLENLTIHYDRANNFFQRGLLWAPLHKLKTLVLIFGDDNIFHFGSAFQNFSRLESLQLSHFGTSRLNLTVEMFRSLTSTLKHLSLASYTMYHIEPGLLHSLSHLQTLELRDATLDSFSNLVRVLPELNNTRIHELAFGLGEDAIKANTLDALKGLLDLEAITIDTRGCKAIHAYAFEGFVHLRKLNLGGGSLQTLQNHSFTGMTSLADLDLGSNDISILPGGVFEGLVSLTHLDLSYNQLESSRQGVEYDASFDFSSFENLSRLNLSFNRLTHVPTVGLPERLDALEVQHNNIGSYIYNSVLFIPHVTYLDVSHNHIQSLIVASPAGTSTLETLKLDNNALKAIDGKFMEGLVTLQTLTLSHNKLQVIEKGTFRWVNKLTKLDISNNKIATIAPSAFRWLPDLEFLDLSNNNIQQISTLTFDGLGNLTELNLAGNEIVDIGNAFDDLHLLRILSLKSNALAVLDQTTVSPVLEQLESIDISGNPFLCDCTLLWFVEWALDIYDTVLDWNNPYPSQSYQCAVPSYLHGRQIKEGLSQKHQNDRERVSTRGTFFNIDCTHKSSTLLAIMLSVAILVVIIAVYVSWKRLKSRGPQDIKIFDLTTKTHDAFVMYSNKDRWWVNKLIKDSKLEEDYRLIDHERDFVGGVNIHENIENAQQGSLRIICVVSENFLQSNWCKDELNRYMYKHADSGGQLPFPIIVLLEDISASEVNNHQGYARKNARP